MELFDTPSACCGVVHSTMAEQYSQHIAEMLSLGLEIITTSPKLSSETGTVNAKGDHSIEMDVKIESAFIDYVKNHNLPANIFSEEIGMVTYHPDPKFLISFDPLDGSTNYKIGQELLPYGTLIAVYDGINPNLNSVIAAGAIEYTHDLAWIFDGEKTRDLAGQEVQLKEDWPVDKSTPVYLDTYYKEGYEDYRPLAQQIFIRNTGSTIGNLSLCLANVAAGIGGVCMRAEEIGAVLALIKGAGGVVINHQGEDIGSEGFGPEKTHQILAGSKNIAEFMVEKLKK